MSAYSPTNLHPSLETKTIFYNELEKATKQNKNNLPIPCGADMNVVSAAAKSRSDLDGSIPTLDDDTNMNG